jgi:tetratricopeptide (TPR) repeat protein
VLTLVTLSAACDLRAQTSTTPPPGRNSDKVILRIASDNTMTLQAVIVSVEDLQNKLAETVKHNPRTTLSIQAEQSTTWAIISKVLNAARAAHLEIARTQVSSSPRVDWSAKKLTGPGIGGRRGMLKPEDAEKLEAKLVEDPEDFSARRDLLAFYGFRDRGAKARHVLWIIEHHPELSSHGPELSLDPIMQGSAFQKGKELWLKNVKDQPANTAILGNAAAYFLVYESETAETLLRKAQALEPKNPGWSEQLGELYELEAQGESGTALAAKAVAEYEKAQTQASPPEAGNPRLSDLAKMALAAGQLDKARKYANELLGPGLDYHRGSNAGEAVFHGNTVLGRIALREGKIDEAKKYLLEAGKTKGSPVLGSFGPSMTLAKELLEKGESDTVLKYFEECGLFWKYQPGVEKLTKWTADVKAGTKPDFAGNLNY